MNMAEYAALDETAHWKQYEKLVQKIAGQILPRAQAIDPSWEFGDAVSFLTVVYMKCKAGFDPLQGYAFTTYLQTSCYRTFNKWSEVQMNMRRVGRVPMSDADIAEENARRIARARRKGETADPVPLGTLKWEHAPTDLSVQAFSERGDGDNRDFYDMLPDGSDSLEDQLDRKRAQQDMARVIAGLPARHRQVIAVLVKGPGRDLRTAYERYREAQLAAGERCPESITVPFICRSLGFTPDEARELRLSFKKAFGVHFTALKEYALA